jgi:hypothetical protein
MEIGRKGFCILCSWLFHIIEKSSKLTWKRKSGLANSQQRKFFKCFSKYFVETAEFYTPTRSCLITINSIIIALDSGTLPARF